MKYRSVRAKALFLLLALVGGGFGMPWYDAVVFHGQPGQAPRAERILTNAGTVAGHDQVCALGLTAHRGNAPPSAPPVLSIASTPNVGVSSFPHSVLVTQTDLALGNSRAPPACPA